MDNSSPSDLEHFRREWQQEVEFRSKQQQNIIKTSWDTASAEKRSIPDRPLNRPPKQHPLSENKDEELTVPESSAPVGPVESLPDSSTQLVDRDEFTNVYQAQPQTAIEHYEHAVRKEQQGNQHDALIHFRKAFKLDDQVDEVYKKKHFAQRWRPAQLNPPNTTVTVPNTPHHSRVGEASDESRQERGPLATNELIASFADAAITGIPPMIEGDTPPPCPISRLPTEVVIEMLSHIACIDPGIYARLAQVSRKLAYHVYSEHKIWRRVALGPEFGFDGQKYSFDVDFQGREAIYRVLDDDVHSKSSLAPLRISPSLFPLDVDWREVFHSHPRIRFSGVYISTVSYTRPGGASITPATWSSTIHVVTYYRYLRFYRDGTVLSLLTTHEPVDVVHLLSKENMHLVRTTKDPSLNKDRQSKRPETKLQIQTSSALYGKQPVPEVPTADTSKPTAHSVLKQALRGRWRLCEKDISRASGLAGNNLSDVASENLDATGSMSVPDNPMQIGPNTALPGDIHIETEGGAGPRYMYTMHLRLTSSNLRNKFATRNNKLVWKGFWSYNSLTNDWAEFQLRHDKQFIFSPVRRYGLGY